MDKFQRENVAIHLGWGGKEAEGRIGVAQAHLGAVSIYHGDV